MALVLLVMWTGLLAAGVLASPGRAAEGGPGLFDLRSRAAVWSAAVSITSRGALDVLRFLPLGLLAVFALPDRSRRLTRVLLVLLPALTLALLLAVLALSVESRGREGAAPGPLDLVLPGMGMLLGVGAGLAWRRGPRARLLFIPTVVVAAVAVLLLGGVAVGASLENEPSAPAPPVVDSAGKRRIHSTLRGKNPRKVPAGERRTLTLTEGDVDFMLAWGLPLVLGPERVRVEVSFEEPQRARATVSARLPGARRWLNVETSARVQVDQGDLDLGEARLRLGRFEVPAPLLGAIVPLVEVALQNDRHLRPILAATETLAVEQGRASATYQRLEAPPGFFARLIWGEGAEEGMRAAVAAHARRLLDAGRLRGDAGFASALEIAFESAGERSGEGLAVQENRAAILALGMLLGHRGVERFVGDVLDEADRGRITALGRPTLRGRADWSRHFLVSAALTVLSAEAPSDAVGLLKEELDAARGSGFSFGDLLADRAGTTFGAVATRDEISAAAMQERIARGFQVDDFLPEAADLPEDLPDAELQSVYGGVGGPGYRRLVDEIERRVAACPAYRP